jgi:hypothetical protein
MMSPSGHPTDNTERVHTQLDYAVTQQHFYSHAHAKTYEGALERVCVVWMSWTDLSVAERVQKREKLTPLAFKSAFASIRTCAHGV